MATGLKDPKIERLDALEHAMQKMVDHLMDLPEARLKTNTSSLSSNAGLMNPKVIELIRQTAIKARKNTATTKNIGDIERIIEHITHEAELEIRKMYNEKPEEEKKKEKEESSSIHQEPSPFGLEDDIIEKGNKPENVNKGTNIAVVQEVKDNPLLAKSEPLTKNSEPNKLSASNNEKPVRGGDSNRIERESKPDRPLIPQQRQNSSSTGKGNPLVAGAPISAIGKSNNAGTTTTSIPKQIKKSSSINTAPRQETNASIKPTKKPLEHRMPEQKNSKPAQSSAEKKAEKTKAPKIEHKAIPYLPAYELGNEDRDYPELDVFAPDEDASGRAAKGNPNAPAGNPNADSQESTQPYQPSASNTAPTSGYQSQGGSGYGGGSGGGYGGASPKSFKGNFPKIPSLPTIPGGGGGGKVGTLIKVAQQTPIGRIVTVGIIVFILLLFILLFIIFGGSDTEEKAKAERDRENASTETLTIDKAMIIPLLPRYEVGQRITFRITVLDTQPAQEITIIDYLPEGVSLLETDVTSSWTKRVYDPVKKTITFKASENVTPAQLTPPSFNFTVTYLITQPYKQYYGGVEANAVASASGNFAGNNLPPSNNNCHGLYSGYMKMLAPIGKTNYGDPTCELVKQGTNSRWFIDKDIMLRYMSQDPTGPKLSEREARGVFECIMPKECSYNVNAYNPNSMSAKSRGTPGAFGCFQMNAQGYSNKEQPEDVGDVVWQLQIHNANQWRLKHNGGTWSRYWPQSYSGCLDQFGL